MESLAPSLDRGIDIMLALNTANELSLDAITQKINAPKSSVSRLLDVLVRRRWVVRNTETKTYKSLVSIATRDPHELSIDRQRRQSMQMLAKKTGCTVEWYLPTAQGQLLIDREEPANQVVRIVAQVGFLRDWQIELDAVCCIGHAFYLKAPKPTNQLATYNADKAFKKRPLKQIKKSINQARQTRSFFDTHYNTHGVRRMAAAITQGNTLIGTLALANCIAHSDIIEQQACLDFLQQEAQSLSF